jgi:ribose transport system substrate-binding protein
VTSRRPRRLYLVPILSKALDIQEVLERAQEPMSLEDIYKAAKCPKTTAYRILKTYVHRGYFLQSPKGLYRIASQPRKIRFGYAAQSSDLPFSQTVTESLQRAALSHGVDLLVMDNHYDPQTAVANARKMVEESVDLVIEFQSDQMVAAEIGDLIASANIPMIAVDIPHPHATYFGADNYRIGTGSGEMLAKKALEQWAGKVSWVLALDADLNGPFVANRIIGSFDAIRKQLPDIPQEFFARADTGGKSEAAYNVVHGFLKRHSKEKGILIVANNDTVALGAVQAIRELQRQKQVMVAGHDAIPEALEELAKKDSPLVGTVYTAADRYGPQLIELGLAILKGQAVSPYNFTSHEVMTRESRALAQTAAAPKA